MTRDLGPFHTGILDIGKDPPRLFSKAAHILRDEILSRSGCFLFLEDPAEGAGDLIRFRLSPGEAGTLDSYAISVKGTSRSADVGIEASGDTAVIHAVGKLLRSVIFKPEGVMIPEMDIRLTATHRHRGQELSTYTYHDSWQRDDWESYTRELALWGANWIWSTTSCEAPLEGCSEETRVRWEKRCSLQDVQADIASRYGMRFGVHSFPNNISPELVTPEISFKGSYVCPSTREGRRLILDSRRMLFRRLSRIDAVFTSSHDPGGCPCPRCTPWVETFVPLAEEEAQIAREHHPESLFYISNQALSRDENLWLFDYLESESPDWLDGIVWGPQSRPLGELREGLPDRYDIIAFPDITHLIICQYPVIGFDHANALVHHRESPTYRPRAMRRIYHETAAESIGSMPYSEGLHDDLNKAVWSGLNWGVEPEESVAEYVRRYLGEGARDAITGAIFDLETSWKTPVVVNERIPEILRAVEGIGPEVEGGPDNWRYRMLLLRCIIDLYVQLRLRRERETESRALDMLKSDMVVDERIDRALEVLSRSKPDTHESDLAGRIARIGKELKALKGLWFHPMDRLEVHLADIPWMKSVLENARSLPDSDREAAISGIVDYEDPGPGGLYEDCGNVEGESHRLEGEDYFLEGLDEGIRLSQRRMSYGRSQWDSDVVYRFRGLDPESAYRLSVTYVTNRRMRGSQILLANGRIVHDDIQLPENTPASYEFELPPELTDGGNLELIFRRGSNGRGPLVSEIWLRPRR